VLRFDLVFGGKVKKRSWSARRGRKSVLGGWQKSFQSFGRELCFGGLVENGGGRRAKMPEQKRWGRRDVGYCSARYS